MVQLETIYVVLNAVGNIAGLIVSKAFCIFVPIFEIVHTTSTFLSVTKQCGLVLLRLVAVPKLEEVVHW